MPRTIAFGSNGDAFLHPTHARDEFKVLEVPAGLWCEQKKLD